MNIDEILNRMTLEDKIALCSGADFWKTKKMSKYGIPELFMCDGPHGLRKQENAADMLGVNRSRKSTCFPTAVTTADSFDVDLLNQIGEAISQEAKNQEVGLVLGPGINIKRNPLCGRNFEYFSEDPYLSGKLSAAFIKGMESNDVGSCLKHFALNSQENSRFVSDGVIDERTLREIYLSGFEEAVKEGKPSVIMCSYPKINGVHASDNKKLLNDILRVEWGYEGAVITDWGAMNDRIEGFKAGCDLNMPGGAAYMENECLKAVKEGRLSEEDINASASRILKLVFEKSAAMNKENCDYESHHLLAQKAAVSGAVLLKNKDNLLPLKKNGKIAVIGDMAKHMRYQGAGSSHINPMKIDEPIDYLEYVSYAQGCDENGNTGESMLEEVASAAKSAEAAVVFAGLPDSYESEGFDREGMKMPLGHLKMIEAAANANPNTVVVLMCGSAVECPFADKVKSILYMGLPGEAGGSAIAKLLYGEISPSGRLAESWPYSYEDVPSSELFGKTKDALYAEGLYVGYRYYEKAGKPVRFPFGHGLSYTCFEYTDLKVDGSRVSVNVKNSGEIDGADAVLLYVCAPQNGLHRPLRELKGFKKIFLKAKEEKTVFFELNERSFAVYENRWVIPEGKYEISVGPLAVSLDVKGEKVAVPCWQKDSYYETLKGKPTVDEWKQTLNYQYSPLMEAKKGSYTMENSIVEMSKDSFVMKMVYLAVKIVLQGGIRPKDPNSPELKMMLNASVGGPLRSMHISSGVAGGVFPGLLEIANGHLLKGVIRMIKGN